MEDKEQTIIRTEVILDGTIDPVGYEKEGGVMVAILRYRAILGTMEKAFLRVRTFYLHTVYTDVQQGFEHRVELDESGVIENVLQLLTVCHRVVDTKHSRANSLTPVPTSRTYKTTPVIEGIPEKLLEQLGYSAVVQYIERGYRFTRGSFSIDIFCRDEVENPKAPWSPKASPSLEHPFNPIEYIRSTTIEETDEDFFDTGINTKPWIFQARTVHDGDDHIAIGKSLLKFSSISEGLVRIMDGPYM